MMNRIDVTFAALKTARKSALIPFITAGDPALDSTLPTMLTESIHQPELAQRS